MDNFDVVDRVFSGVGNDAIFSEGAQVVVQPNPSSGNATLYFLSDGEIIAITITSIDGRVIRSDPPLYYSTGRHSLALPASLASGTYIITVRTSGGTLSVVHVRL
jgi:hypothetical protein